MLTTSGESLIKNFLLQKCTENMEFVHDTFELKKYGKFSTEKYLNA